LSLSLYDPEWNADFAKYKRKRFSVVTFAIFVSITLVVWALNYSFALRNNDGILFLVSSLVSIIGHYIPAVGIIWDHIYGRSISQKVEPEDDVDDIVEGKISFRSVCESMYLIFGTLATGLSLVAAATRENIDDVPVDYLLIAMVS